MDDRKTQSFEELIFIDGDIYEAKLSGCRHSQVCYGYRGNNWIPLSFFPDVQRLNTREWNYLFIWCKSIGSSYEKKNVPMHTQQIHSIYLFPCSIRVCVCFSRFLARMLSFFFERLLLSYNSSPPRKPVVYTGYVACARRNILVGGNKKLCWSPLNPGVLRYKNFDYVEFIEPEIEVLSSSVYVIFQEWYTAN